MHGTYIIVEAILVKEYIIVEAILDVHVDF